MIQPLDNDEPKKDINELLAEEEAKEAAAAPVDAEPAAPDTQVAPEATPESAAPTAEAKPEEKPADPNKPNPADIAL